jgi:hypothetical protein
MQDEFVARQRAITLRLAGRLTKAICAAVGRSEVWFRKWWGRYLESGPEGLYDLTRANHHVAQRIPPELERAILSVRRRLQAHATPATRYCLIGATAILAELRGLGVRPLPCERTISAPKLMLMVSELVPAWAGKAEVKAATTAIPTMRLDTCRFFVRPRRMLSDILHVSMIKRGKLKRRPRCHAVAIRTHQSASLRSHAKSAFWKRTANVA